MSVKGKTGSMGVPSVGVQSPTPAECAATGGHCWREASQVVMRMSADGYATWELPDGSWQAQPPEFQRTCKHCGKRQVGTPQEQIRWEDEP